METWMMGNWEPAAHTERVQVGNPPPKIARAILLLDVILEGKRGKRGKRVAQKAPIKIGGE